MQDNLQEVVIMAGMFYSLKETAGKLNITEQQVQQLARDGKLREFRDGATVLFKVDEVEALMTETPKPEPEEAPVLLEEESEPEETPVQLEEVEEQVTASEEPVEEVSSEPQQQQEPASGEAAPVEQKQQAETDKPQPGPEEVSPEGEPKAETPAPEVAPEDSSAELDLLAEGGAGGTAGKEALGEAGQDSGEILLGSDIGEGSGVEQELTDSDTFAGIEGLNVLGETGGEIDATEDTGADTLGATTGEASLEEIEEDVNLDSFGSGSGLLDLSLQADDTSLGGILDEIYTAEGEQETAEGPAIELDGEQESPELAEEEEYAEPEPAPEASLVTTVRAEAAPDKLSNALGIVLFVPLLAIVYTAIVAIAGFQDVMPATLAKLQGIEGPGGIHIIWYVGIALMVVALVVVGAGSMLGGGTAQAGKKQKAKKAKKGKRRPGVPAKG